MLNFKRFVTAIFATLVSTPAIADLCETPNDSLWIILDEAPGEVHYNWYRAGADRSHGAVQGLLEPLFALHPETGDEIPWLAVSYRFVSETRVEIRLRRQAKWSNGDPFTAEDVRFSLQTVLDNEALDGPGLAALRETVVAVAAPRRRRVVIDLAEPDPDFVRKFLTAGENDGFAVVPKLVWQGEDPLIFENKTPLGTGPYEFDDDPKGWADWTLNRDWWGEGVLFTNLPKPERIDWTSASRSEDDVRALTYGCADILAGTTTGLAEGIMSVAPYVDTLEEPAGGSVNLYSQARWTDWDKRFDVSTEAILNHHARWLIHDLERSDLRKAKQLENR